MLILLSSCSDHEESSPEGEAQVLHMTKQEGGKDLGP